MSDTTSTSPESNPGPDTPSSSEEVVTAAHTQYQVTRAFDMADGRTAEVGEVLTAADFKDRRADILVQSRYLVAVPVPALSATAPPTSQPGDTIFSTGDDANGTQSGPSIQTPQLAPSEGTGPEGEETVEPQPEADLAADQADAEAHADEIPGGAEASTTEPANAAAPQGDEADAGDEKDKADRDKGKSTFSSTKPSNVKGNSKPSR